MAAQIGLNMLVKVDSDGAGTYLTMAGGRTVSVKMNRQTVDVTSQDDVDRYRQLIDDAGVRTVDVSFAGVFKDAAADLTTRQYWSGDTHRNWEITMPSFCTFTGPFAVTDIEYGGAHDGEVTMTVSLASAGTITIAAI